MRWDGVLGGVVEWVDGWMGGKDGRVGKVGMVMCTKVEVWKGVGVRKGG